MGAGDGVSMAPTLPPSRSEASELAAFEATIRALGESDARLERTLRLWHPGKGERQTA